MAARVLPSSSRSTPARIGSRAPWVLRGWPTTGVSGGGVTSILAEAALRFDWTGKVISSARPGRAIRASPIRYTRLARLIIGGGLLGRRGTWSALADYTWKTPTGKP